MEENQNPSVLDWIGDKLKALQPGQEEQSSDGGQKPTEVDKTAPPAEEKSSKKVVKKKKNKSEAATEPEDQTESSEETADEEPMKAITIRMPISLHRRLMNIKYDCPGETIATLGMRAIADFVAVQEERKKKK